MSSPLSERTTSEVTISNHFEVVAELTAERDSARTEAIADVVDALRNVNWHTDDWKEAAAFIERQFGAAS